nr:molybdenum cofactor biosynthesis protein MoaE [Granulicella aggregans]
MLYFGILKDTLGQERESLELGDAATVEDVVRLLRARASNGSDAIWHSMAVAVNREYAGSATVLRDGDEVAFLPPVSGGAGVKVALQREKIDSEEVVAALKAGEDGALVVFDGIVRNNTRGRKTMYLVYEAYEDMALEQMRGLANQTLGKFAVRDVAIVHRLGKLEVGESSVLIAVASAHRGAAFEACRWVIDTLKKTVPIWKKEHFVDGAVWADGEPFPDEISTVALG